jgi:hypothetical protein
VVAHALCNMPDSPWSAARVPLTEGGHATATDFVLDPSTRGPFVMGDGCHAVGIWITDTQRLIVDAADKNAIVLTREHLHGHCKLAVGPPGAQGCHLYRLTLQTEESKT